MTHSKSSKPMHASNCCSGGHKPKHIIDSMSEKVAECRGRIPASGSDPANPWTPIPGGPKVGGGGGAKTKSRRRGDRSRIPRSVRNSHTFQRGTTPGRGGNNGHPSQHKQTDFPWLSRCYVFVTLVVCFEDGRCIRIWN